MKTADDYEIEIVRLRQIIVTLENKNNLQMLDHNTLKKKNEKIADLELANWELTTELAYTKEQNEEYSVLLSSLLTGESVDKQSLQSKVAV